MPALLFYVNIRPPPLIPRGGGGAGKHAPGSFGKYAERAGGQLSPTPARYGGGSTYRLYEPKSYSSSGTASPEPWPKA